MVTNSTMAVHTAQKIVDFLNGKGIKAESDFTIRPVKKTLRDCWYVKKLVECGCTDCIHIDLKECGSFLAVTNDCKLMSGHHHMITDAIYAIFLDYVDTEDKDDYPHYHIPMKSYCDEDCEMGMYLVEPFHFMRWIETQEFYN